MSYVVKSNRHERTLVSVAELPAAQRADFDYITGEDVFSPRLVEYRGAWYDTSDTEGLAPSELRARGWDTYLTDTFWSGIVFCHFDRDGHELEGVIVGRFYVED